MVVVQGWTRDEGPSRPQTDCLQAFILAPRGKQAADRCAKLRTSSNSVAHSFHEHVVGVSDNAGIHPVGLEQEEVTLDEYNQKWPRAKLRVLGRTARFSTAPQVPENWDRPKSLNVWKVTSIQSWHFCSNRAWVLGPDGQIAALRVLCAWGIPQFQFDFMISKITSSRAHVSQKLRNVLALDFYNREETGKKRSICASAQKHERDNLGISSVMTGWCTKLTDVGAATTRQR